MIVINYFLYLYVEPMSSTSAEIDAAKKMAKRVEAGEQVFPVAQHNVSHAAAEQLTTSIPQQPDAEIPKGTTTGGLNRENMQVTEVNEAVPVVHDREIAPVVGLGQEHNLRRQFFDPTIRAEDQTAIPDAQMTSSEKQTQLTTAEKQTRVEEIPTTGSSDGDNNEKKNEDENE